MNSDAYNPDQDAKTRKELRSGYRTLLDKHMEQSELLAMPGHAEDIQALIKDSNNLFKNVQNPREGAMDSKFLNNLSAVTAQQAQKLSTSVTTYDPRTFVQKMSLKLKKMAEHVRSEIEDEEVEEGAEWPFCGKYVGELYRTAHAVTTFMNGVVPNLDVKFQPKPKTQRQTQSRVKQKLELVDEVEDTREHRGLETSHLVKHTFKALEKEQKRRLEAGEDPLEFLEFFTSPDSFSHTVENMFHLSFLIKTGQVKAFEDPDTHCLRIDTVDSHAENDLASLPHKQTVIKLDMDSWKNIKDAYALENPVIPPRSERATTSYLPTRLIHREVEDESAEDEAPARKKKKKSPAKASSASKKRKANAVEKERDESEDEHEEEEQVVQSSAQRKKKRTRVEPKSPVSSPAPAPPPSSRRKKSKGRTAKQ